MDYDLAIIGAGWAGFNAAKKAKALGLKAVVIEQDKTGGTCLNRGCIPTKALIQSAKVYSLARKSSAFGIDPGNPKINFSQIQSRKEKIVSQLGLGMSFVLKGTEFINAQARIISANTLQAGDRQINAKHILIASGSKPMELKPVPFDGKKIISSDELLELKEVPGSLLIIGGGVIGCEFASLFSIFGTKVTVVELMPQLLPGMDMEVARKLENIYRKKGISVNTGTDAAKLDFDQYELVLVAIGRVSFTGYLGLEQAGVKFDKSRVEVDEYQRTSVPNIYAAGDCTAKLMLAHYAAYQGETAVWNMANPSAMIKCDNRNIPGCIFSDPEISSVGLTPEQAQGLGLEVKVSKFDFMASGMARILDETEGFIKIVSQSAGGKLLGATIIGPRATELIAILTVAISAGLTVEDLKNTVFAHPTLSEGIREAL